MIKLLIVSLSFVVLSAIASDEKEPIARIVELEGIATVYSDEKYMSASIDYRLYKDDFVFTASGSTTTIEYEDGCRVKLEENQKHEITEQGCAGALFAFPVLIAPAIGAPVALSAGAVGLVSITQDRENKALSAS